MRVRMKSTHAGSNNGFVVQDFVEGQEYEVSANLGAIFVKEGWAVDVKPAPKPEPKDDPKADAKGGPKENKAVAPEANKKD